MESSIKKCASTTATSDTWKFYLAGTPASNYPPYPVSLVGPSYWASINLAGNPMINVTMQWTGSDPDGNGDIAWYDLYLDKDNAAAPTRVQSNLTTSSSVQNLAAWNYFWKVVTKDNSGNFTPSEVFTFTVKP
jgi:hypothetical protein